VSEQTTDEDASTEPESPDNPKWRQYELDVTSELKKIDPRARVTHNAAVVGRYSSRSRQIDVLAEHETVGVTHLVVVECKRYTRKLGIGKVDEFVGKLIDVGAEMGVLYAYSGVTPSAQQRADGQKQPSVTVRDLAPDVAVSSVTETNKDEATVGPTTGNEAEASWGLEANRALGFAQCRNENCYQWEVELSRWPSGELAGYCDSCGTFTHECSACGESDAIDLGINECFTCGAHYEVEHDGKGEPTDIVRIQEEEPALSDTPG
jgi:hypothetical protein